MVAMLTQYGFPIVNSANVFSVLEELGIKRWPRIEGPVLLEKYLGQDLTDRQKREVEKFAPRVEVDIFEDPTGRPFTGFRAAWHYGAGTRVFTILPGDLVPIAAEFRHGAEVISLILPGGTFEEKDSTPGQCAKREFEAETGIMLDYVMPLETIDVSGIPVSARQTNQRCHGFLGILPKSLKIAEQRLEPREFLKIVLIPVSEWVKLIMDGQVKEGSAIISTFQALHRLNRIALLEGGSK